MPKVRAKPNLKCVGRVSIFSWSFFSMNSTVCVNTANAMGTIIIVVAVLLIHMERKAVATIKPKIIRLLLNPTRRMVCKAIRRCRFHFSMAIAIKKPPKNRKIK